MATIQASPATATALLTPEVMQHIARLDEVQRQLGHGNWSLTFHYDSAGQPKIVTFTGPAGKIYLNP